MEGIVNAFNVQTASRNYPDDSWVCFLSMQFYLVFLDSMSNV